MELVRITTAGSVDDGKSTLIGRLFYDCGNLYEDQIESIKSASAKKGTEMDLSLITDGLAAEREQGITIDVAYRYFSLPNRRLIIADVPGHEQYTRNMVTGASNANIFLILVDARKGLIRQTKRHLFVASLLRISHVVVVVNKMDMVDYDESVFKKIKKDIADFASKLELSDIQYIPVSALEGDMVVHRKENMNWFNGRTLLDYLENIEVVTDSNLIDFRFPVQYVVRPHQDFRGYAGYVSSGVVRVGEKVKILPSMKEAQIESLSVSGNDTQQIFAGQSSVISIDREIDIKRGDFIVRENNLPEISSSFDAQICWMGDDALDLNKSYFIKIGTMMVRSNISKLFYLLNIETLHREKEGVLHMNDIGKVSIQTKQPVIFDTFKTNKKTGCFIVIDEKTNNTVAAGVVLKSNDVASDAAQVGVKAKLLKPFALWFTGLSGSGKSTVSEKLGERLLEMGVRFEHIDGDVMRETLTKDLSFTPEDRNINIERAGFVANLLSKNDVPVLASFITPYKKQRDELRKNVTGYVEVFIDTSLEECEKRDVKGLYKKARNGEIEHFTGVHDPYEEPQNFEIRIQTKSTSVEDAVSQIVEYLVTEKYLFYE